MFCAIKERKFSDFSSRLQETVIRDRMPFMGAFELTYRCNLSCKHCYCNQALNDGRRVEELSTDEVKRILDEIAGAGCLWLLLTGGEILARKDFPEIYVHALRQGMITEIFTNASLIDEKTAALFAEYPPIGVDISIYGSNSGLHDSITGVKGSFAKTMEGLAYLKKRGVKFSLKTIAMTLNYHDLENIRKLAGEIGAKFHYDTLVSPRTDGGAAPVRYRLDIDTMVGYDLDDEKDFKDCDNVFSNFWNKKAPEALNCGAGVFAFNINPYGALSPCTMFSSFQYPLRTSSFNDAWKRMVVEYGNRQNDFIPAECKACAMLLMCPRCAAWAETETGSVSKKVDHLCEYARCLERNYFKKKEEMENEEKSI